MITALATASIYIPFNIYCNCYYWYGIAVFCTMQYGTIKCQSQDDASTSLMLNDNC